MTQHSCPFCGQAVFATACSDCQSEGIKIQSVRSIFHIGKCHRCGHSDSEPCPGRVRTMRRAWARSGRALKHIRTLAARLAVRAAETLRGALPQR